jgi:hypothetical protein
MIKLNYGLRNPKDTSWSAGFHFIAWALKSVYGGVKYADHKNRGTLSRAERRRYPTPVDYKTRRQRKRLMREFAAGRYQKG